MVLLNQLIKADEAAEEEEGREKNAGVNVENHEENLEEKNAERAGAEEEENNSIFIKIKY